MKDKKAIYIAINNISKKINEIQRSLDNFFGCKCEKNEKSIETTDGGLIDVADILSAHDEAIEELASIIS